jgi:hypothetical protein
MRRRGPRAIKVTVGDRCVYFAAAPWSRGCALEFDGSIHVRCPGCKKMWLQGYARVSDDRLSASCTCGAQFAIEKTKLTKQQVTAHHVRDARQQRAVAAITACCTKPAAAHLFNRMSDAHMYNMMGDNDAELDAAIGAVNAALQA